MTVPKILGADVELANFILGRGDGGTETGDDAATALLAEIDGVDAHDAHPSARDWGRRYLASNGGCAYIDLAHLEICLPETRSAFDFLAAWHAMLRVAERARVDAESKLPPEEQLVVVANSSDGLGNSYGSHLNFSISRETWDRMFQRRLDDLLFLASHQVSSIVYTGQGKVGAENGAAPVPYQISQRADFIETMVGPQTTFNRPLVNTRDEAFSALGARLHVIFYDTNLAHAATVLKVGVYQIVLAMLETGWTATELLLNDPLAALAAWSHDLSLQTRVLTFSGMQLTAVEHQLLLLEQARRFVEVEGIDHLVPRADEILLLWEDTLLKLESKDFPSLASRLDWVAKLSVLERVLDEHPELDWSAPGLKHLDQTYASSNPEQGLYWSLEREGRFEILVSEADIERFVIAPPDDTRAWTRAMLLRASGAREVDHVDWDRVRFKEADGSTSTVYLPDPAGATRHDTEIVFRTAGTLSELTTMLGARRQQPHVDYYGGPS